jgi:hypothetical protein
MGVRSWRSSTQRCCACGGQSAAALPGTKIYRLLTAFAVGIHSDFTAEGNTIGGKALAV